LTKGMVVGTEDELIARLREELNMVRREYEKIQQLQQAMGLSP